MVAPSAAKCKAYLSFSQACKGGGLAGRAPVAALAAVLFQHADVRHHHAAIHRFAHIETCLENWPANYQEISLKALLYAGLSGIGVAAVDR